MNLTRRELLKKGSIFCLAGILGHDKILKAALAKEKEFEIVPALHVPYADYFSAIKPVVGIVKIDEKWSEAKGVEYAVTKAIDLIGGLPQVTKSKERIIIKPNLCNYTPSDTTNPRVIEVLAGMMKKAGKDVYVGEASAASVQNIDINLKGYVCSTKNYKTLEAIQDDVFNKLGYLELSKRIDDINIVGERLEAVRQQFKKPTVVPYTMIQDWYGPPCNY
jgi:hypothetical protein